jgi:hypothetical protein
MGCDDTNHGSDNVIEISSKGTIHPTKAMNDTWIVILLIDTLIRGELYVKL